MWRAPFKCLKNWFTLFFLGFISHTLIAQDAKTDSLLTVFLKSKDDTSKVRTGNNLARRYQALLQFSKSLDYLKQNVALGNALNFKKGLASSYYLTGYAHYKIGNFDEALINYSHSLELYKELKMTDQVASNYGSMGNVHYQQGIYPKALDYFIKALTIYEELKMKKSIAGYSGNIGALYERMGVYTSALDYYARAMKINKEINNKQGVAINLVCIGNIYSSQDKDSIALGYHTQALELNKEIGDKDYYANNLSNIGTDYLNVHKSDKAVPYLIQAIEIYEEMGSKSSISSTYGHLGKAYIDLKKYPEAESYLQKGLQLAKEINARQTQADNQIGLSNLYSATGQYDKSLFHYKEYIRLKDSIFSDKNQKQFVQNELQFEFDKKEAVARSEFEKRQAINLLELSRKKQDFLLLERDNELKKLSLNQSNLALEQQKAEGEVRKKQVELLNKDVLLKDAESKEKAHELEKQKLVRNVLVVGALIFLGLTFFIARNLLQSKRANKIISRQKLEVESQRNLVEEKNKEITDSITYAKRLQDAILPAREFVNTYLPDNFIFYKPKDIVAGDFYWMEIVDQYIFIAAADSTGHGVPGAMVSVVCSNALNRTVKEFGLRDTGQILDKARDLVLETFAKSDAQVMDGMDISLLSINTLLGTYHWSGANSPCWFFHDNEMQKVTANKQPIGKMDDPQPFQTHALNLTKGDCVYLFTDGYADQFGGEKGKKFKYKQLEALLVSIKNNSLVVQKDILEETFNRWKDNLEQVDDVTVLGIRI